MTDKVSYEDAETGKVLRVVNSSIVPDEGSDVLFDMEPRTVEEVQYSVLPSHDAVAQVLLAPVEEDNDAADRHPADKAADEVMDELAGLHMLERDGAPELAAEEAVERMADRWKAFGGDNDA